MAFETSESNNNFKKYTGLNKVKVIAVNPNKAELNALGINFKEEPLYITKDKDGKPLIKVDFWVKQEESGVITAVKYVLRPEIRKSNDGVKTQYIDKFGGTTWSANKPILSTEYFDATSAKEAYNGEEDLIRFIKNFMDVKKGGEAKLNTEILIKGDFTEVKSLPMNKSICVGFTVSQNKYQNILPGWSARHWMTNDKIIESFTKYVTKKSNDGYPLKDAYSIEWKEYSEVIPDEDPKPNFPESMNNDPLPF